PASVAWDPRGNLVILDQAHECPHRGTLDRRAEFLGRVDQGPVVAGGIRAGEQQFGIGAALRWAAAMHGLTSASLLALGIVLGLGPVYYLGWAVATVLLVYEHWLLLPEDLSRLDTAFFNVNGYLSIIIFLCTGASVLFRV
ncbi:MAG: hypothetical protein AAB369_00580, partial [Chloroflexota bacterium]